MSTDTLEPPKQKPKRQMSDAQREAFTAGRAKGAAAMAAKKAEKEAAKARCSVLEKHGIAPALAPRWPTLDRLEHFYGRLTFAADGQIDERRTRHMRSFVRLPIVMRMAWLPEINIQRIVCHKQVQRDLEAIFRELRDCTDEHERRQSGDDIFGGGFSFGLLDRILAYVLSPSCYGAALTFNPGGQVSSKLAEIFARHGWSRLGNKFYAATL